MARFFIDRPVFAWVIALVIMLAGALAIRTLPITQYPTIAPPAVVINASYPGASAKTLEDSVTQVIEQKMTGLDNLLYMSSSSDSSGRASVKLTFNAGTDPDIAQVQVQNKLQLAMPSLPLIVQNQGVQVAKTSASFLMVVGLTSEDGKQTQSDLSDYLISNVQDPLSRIQGVGEVQVFGGQYAMRIWLDPAKLLNYKLTPADVKSALQAQNAQVSAGQLGGSPSVEGQQLNATVCKPPSSSRRSCCAPRRRAPVFTCVTLPALRSVRKTMASSAATTASRPPVWPSAWPPTPTRWRRRTRCVRRLPNYRNSSRRASARSSPSTRPPSSGFRSKRWSRR